MYQNFNFLIQLLNYRVKYYYIARIYGYSLQFNHNMLSVIRGPTMVIPCPMADTCNYLYWWLIFVFDRVDFIVWNFKSLLETCLSYYLPTSTNVKSDLEKFAVAISPWPFRHCHFAGRTLNREQFRRGY